MKWKEVSANFYEEGQEFIGILKVAKKNDEGIDLFINQGDGKTLEVKGNFKLKQLIEKVPIDTMVKVTYLGVYKTKNGHEANNWKVEVPDNGEEDTVQ